MKILRLLKIYDSYNKLLNEIYFHDDHIVQDEFDFVMVPIYQSLQNTQHILYRKKLCNI